MKNRNLLLSICLMVSVCFAGSASLAQSTGSSFILPEFSRTVSLDFKAAALDDVLRAFSEQIGVGFLTSKGVKADPMTVFLERVPVEEALDRILSAHDFVYEYDQDANIIMVKPAPASIDKDLITRVYHLQFATLSDSLMAEALSSGVDANLKVSAESVDSTDSEDSTSKDRKFESGIAGAIEAILVAKEGSNVVQDPRTNSLIVTDVRSNFLNIERVIARLDTPVAQVSIEVEMLDVSRNALDEVGMKFGSQLFSVDGSGIDMAAHGGFARYANMSKLFEQGGITFNASPVFDFLRTHTDTRSLARPRIMTMDNQTATIKIATNEAIGIESITEDTSGNLTVQAERTETGVLLSVTPQVSSVTNEITLVVEPKLIEAKQGDSFSYGEGLSANFKNPEERGIKTILKVKSGEMIVMGGLVRRQEDVIETRLPFLGSLPLIGRALFRHTKKDITERELLIFMTPKVINNSADEFLLHGAKGGAPGISREQMAPNSRFRMIEGEMDKFQTAR